MRLFFASVIAVVETFHYRVGRSDTHGVEAGGVWNDCCVSAAGNDRLDHCFVTKPRSGSFPSTGHRRAFAAVWHRIVAQSNIARGWCHPASRLKCNICPPVGHGRAACDYVESWGFYRSVFVIQPVQEDHAMPAPLSLDIRRRFQCCIEHGLAGRAAARRLMILPATGARLAGRIRSGQPRMPAKCGRPAG